MHRIVPDIATLEQHLALLCSDPERYRPSACAVCGLASPWAHGFYTRKSDRSPSGDGAQNPIPIPRFICRNPECRRSCSRLPACIPPRRWYLWIVQQVVLAQALAGGSLRGAARAFAPCRGPARSTIRRWRDWLGERGADFTFLLKGRFAALARLGDDVSFWQSCLSDLGLMEVMATLDGLGEVVP